MVKITKSEREGLEKYGLLKHKKIGYGSSDPSFYVANKDHTGRNKHTYVVEDPEVMKFLGRYDNLNLQRINFKQFESLKDNGFINDENIQKWGTYNPKAICYENAFGEYRITKITSMMLFLGLWKDNKRKKLAKVQQKTMLELEKGVQEENSSKDSYPDINEQAKALGMPEVIFREVETGEVVASGGLELLEPYMGKEYVENLKTNKK